MTVSQHTQGYAEKYYTGFVKNLTDFQRLIILKIYLTFDEVGMMR